MNTSPTALLTETSDLTPDTGPVHRGDTKVWFWTIVAGIAAIALTVTGWHIVPWACWMPLVALGIPCVYGVWSIYRTHADRVDVPRSHVVLAGELGFDLLATCRGVAATAFFAPDSVVHGGETRLFLFLENYMSRHRIVTARFGHLPGIGRPEATYVTLRLAAGQAAVYVMPVRMRPDIASGFHRLSVQVTVEQPAGVGQRLRAARTRIRDMSMLRFAAPFELATGRPEAIAPQKELPKPRYISLASVSEKEAAIERLFEVMGQA